MVHNKEKPSEQCVTKAGFETLEIIDEKPNTEDHTGDERRKRSSVVIKAIKYYDSIDY